MKRKPKPSVGVGAGVHWFVAWRYLLADPRQFSRAILRFIGANIWMIIAFGAVSVWLFPLAHPILSPYQPIPWWLLTAFSVLVVGTFLAPLVGGLATASLVVAMIGGRAGLRLFDAVAARTGIPEARANDPDPRLSPPWAAISGVVCGFGALSLLGLFRFLYRPFTDPPVLGIPLYIVVLGALAGLVLVTALPALLAWYVRARAEHHRVGGRSGRPAKDRGAAVTRVVVVGLVYVLLALLALVAISSFWGFRDVLWPASRSVGQGRWLFFPGVAITGIGSFALVATLVNERLQRRGMGWIALRLINTGLMLLVVLGFLHLRDLAAAGMPEGPAALAKLPASVVLPVLIGGALAILNALLICIRFFFTFFSTVSIGGVAIGTMALVIVLSVMSGFENDLRRKILGSNAHVLVTKATDKPLICRALPNLHWKRCVLDVESAFTNYRAVGKQINGVKGVVASSPYLISEVVIAANNNYANVIIKGVEPETVGSIGELDENVKFENGDVDRDALMRLWPLAEDGSVIGRPASSGHSSDDSDDDVDGDGFSDAIPDAPTPLDFSGGDDDPDSDDPDSDDPGGDDDPPGDDGDDAPGDDGDDPSGDDGDDGDDDDLDGGFDEDLVPLRDLPPLIDDDGEIFDLDSEKEFVRRIPPLVAILPGTLVGKELVKQINLYDGQEVKIVSPLGQDTPLGPVPRTKRFRVAGTFFTGMYEYDLKFIYVEIGALQDFLDLGDEVTGIEIRLEDPSDMTDVVARLGEALGLEYRIQDWQELNRSLFSALKLEKIAMFLILAIIILVASFSIVGNLIMVVVEKAREIAVLKTLGTSDVGIMKIFITQGFFIGLVGTSIGVSLGLAACLAMQTFGLPLDPDVYYIDRLPIHIEPLSVALVFGAGIVISVVATLYPAYVAAGMRPVNGLRYE